MTNGILLNGSADIDFMIHGVFPYQFFGQTVWITTTHICLLIVLLLILAFAIAANRAMKHASEVPGFFQNIVELVVEKLDGMVKMVMGKNAAKFANYIHFYPDQQLFRSAGVTSADGGLRRYPAARSGNLYADSLQQAEA